MTKINIDFIPKSREYLKKFIDSNRNQFFLDMKEYTPQNGYGPFLNSSKIVKCMREIAHIIDEQFTDLSIPETYATTSDLISAARNFVEHLKSFERIFKSTYLKYQANPLYSFMPQPILEINNNRIKTIKVFESFINLAEAENQEENFHDISTKMNDIEKIEILIESFHNVTNQLQYRRNEGGISRPTIIINDEYDVQDLLHGLLRIYFEDIRPEEWNPSYAGSSSRSDFLLKDEKIVIEVKKTRQNLKDRAIGEQLIIDIAKYRNHPDCKTLVCFVYDPEHLILNPRGLENDLSSVSPDFKVYVYIRPK